MDYSNILSTLKELLTIKRYEHSLGVQKTAIKLAKIYNCDCEKASIAGVLHDCAKDLKKEMLFKKCEKYNIYIDDISKKEVQLLHGSIGAFMAKDIFGINDEEILNAIKYHTLSRENMTLLDKIIYISDFIEPGRDFDGVEVIRKAAYKDLNQAIILGINNSINHLMIKGKLIHPDTIKARNYLLLEKKK